MSVKVVGVVAAQGTPDDDQAIDDEMFTPNSVFRVVEEFGYVLSVERHEETESVWNVVAATACERGSGALVEEVRASYEMSSI